MKHYLIAGLMATIAMGALTTSTYAADLNYEDSYERYSSSGSPYDDPRYASIYGRSSNQRVEIEVDPLPRNRSSYRSTRSYSYSSSREQRCLRPYDSTHQHTSNEYYSDVCLSKYQIRRKLKRQGWRGFELIRANRRIAVITARQIGGDRYKLRVDRCSGEVLRARVIDSYANDSYAYRSTTGYKSY